MGCLLIAATLVMGTTVNGASRWLVLGPLQIQPSELVKPFVVLQAANLFAPWCRMRLDQKLLWLGGFGGLLLLILKQPNLSTAALIGLTLWMVALASGIRWRSLLGTAIAGGALGTASILINEYQRLRVVSFLDPGLIRWGTAISWCKACWPSAPAASPARAMASPPRSCSTCRSRAPISSMRCSPEFGFVGSVVLLLFLMLVAWVGLRVALRCRCNQTRLVAIGCCTIWWASRSSTSLWPPGHAHHRPAAAIGELRRQFADVQPGDPGLLVRCSLESTG